MVRLRGLPSETTERFEAEFGTAFEAWGNAGAEGAPPQQPADGIFPELDDVSIGDNVGTHYAIRSSARGGSNRLFRADYVFTPGTPETAETVEVRVGDATPVQV